MTILLVPSVAQVLLDPIAPRPLGLLVALASVLPVAWRRTSPSIAAAVGTSAWLLPTEGYLILGFVVAAVLFYSVGAYERRSVIAAGVTLWGSVIGVYSILASSQPPESAFVLLVVVVAPVVVGRVVREWERRAAELADLAARLEGERRQAEELAVARERNRIARELHDVVGHDVTVMALQADAAIAALEHDPPRAAEPVQAIRRTAAHTMHEMRRFVGALRAAEGDTEGTTPPPGPGDLERLVADSRSLGQPVELTTTGQPCLQHAAVGLALYRVVQESLTNARRHAPGMRVDVDIAWGSDAVDVRVQQPLTQPQPARNGGLGLVGMQERVRLIGGALSAGPDDQGRFLVHARLPYDDERGAR
jgi:signal transduction histidine kinase